MTESIFTPDQGEVAPASQEAPAATTPAAPVIPTELQEFVGEGKKFKSVADYVSGYKNSQEFIGTLKTETATMREELAKRKAAEELLQEIRTTPTEQQKPTSQGVEVNEDVLSEIVERKLLQKEAQRSQADNARSVVQSLGSTFGDKGQEVFNKVAAENEMTPQQFEKLAATNPKMVLKLCGATDVKKPGSTAIESSINTLSLGSQPKQDDGPSLLLPKYPTSRDLAAVWEASKERVYKRNNITE